MNLSRITCELKNACITTFAILLVACGGSGGNDDINTPPPVANPPAPPPISLEARNEAALLANQATFGMPWETLEDMARQGRADWLESQFARPVTYHRPTIVDIVRRRDAGEFDAFEDDIEYLIFARRLAWWHNTVIADDTLRQRVAFALSQIFVVSDNVDVLEVYPNALGGYYDMLLDNAFGNYRDLLRDVTYSPAMGVYLSHLNNAKADPGLGTFPDENYAREVMQLFSIGLFELNEDGSRKRDSNGDAIPTYDNTDIGEFAKVFTGFSFGGPGAVFGNNTEPNFSVPMQLFDEAHSPGEKQLLRGVSIPDGLTATQDVEAAIDNLFNHPNVGPFLGRLLIQRLVTSNPSPAYVARVSRAFADNGLGVRGDMKAVIRAILLDPEATNPPDAFTGGKLTEPVVRYVSMLRRFGARSDDGFIAALGYFLQIETLQHPLSSRSVFNFYLPDHQPSGAIADAGLYAPELQIIDANTVISWANFIDAIFFGDVVTDAPAGFNEVTLEPTRWLALTDTPSVLVDELNTLITAGTASQATLDAVVTSISEFPQPELRLALAVYYLSIAPEGVHSQ
ncbi:MAG: DUF1800 domain-containing protein [Pseudomonadota bacterium]